MGRKPVRAQHARTPKPKRDFPNRLLDRYQIVFVLAVLLSASTLAWATMAIFVPAPPSHIIIAGGPKGGSYEQYAMRYREILARSHVKVDVRTTDGAGENLKLLEDSTSGVVAGFALGGIAKKREGAGCEIAGPDQIYGGFCLLSGERTPDRLGRAQEQAHRCRSRWERHAHYRRNGPQGERRYT